MLLDAHTHLDHYDDTALDVALDEMAAHRILTVAVAMDPCGRALPRLAIALMVAALLVVPGVWSGLTTAYATQTLPLIHARS